ncbi:MAG: hypothetical protein KJO72_03245 [Gammaproteobacteria bacterium]|nr:hypothetical protein [Gammaproteobacteria bacterium]
MLSYPVLAQSTDEASTESLTGDDAAPEEIEADEPSFDGCKFHVEEDALQEKSQEFLRSSSCHTFRWVDSWWGDEYAFDAEELNGWFTVGGEYRDYDGFDGRLRLRVRAPLPNMSNRWDVWLGRIDEEAYISDTEGQNNNFNNTGNRDADERDSWLFGLGHRRFKGNSGWDWSLGARLNWPPEPYAKVSYFHYSKPSESTNLRLRQTLFWRGDDHRLGTTSRGDFSWRVNEKDLIFWDVSSTWSRDTEGARWYAGQTWYHLRPTGGAYSLRLFMKGETERDVPLRDYGINLIYRFPFTRDYIYLSYGPSLTWPRKRLEDKREANLGFGVWIEIEFGNWRY